VKAVILAVIAALLVISSFFTERRSVHTWAPNAVVAKPKSLETAAISLPKPNATIVAAKNHVLVPERAPEQPGSGTEAAARRSTTMLDQDATGTLPNQVALAQATTLEISPAPSHAWRERGRAARMSYRTRAPLVYARQTRGATATSSPEPIQFRLAQGRN
jgi:hypothetical protein